MRRPVGVKWVLGFLLVKFFPLPSSRCRHASIRTLEERLVRSVQVGRSRFSRRCYLFGALCSALAEWNLGQAINAVTGTRLGLFFTLQGTILFYAAVATVA